MPIYKANGKKDGLQKYNVRINYTDAEGKGRQLTRVAYGLDAAKKLERELTINLSTEKNRKITLQDVYDEYLLSMQSELRETSLNKNKSRLEMYVLPTLGKYRIEKINSQIIQRWKNDIEQVKIKNGTAPMSLNTKQGLYSVFRAFLNYAVRMEYIDKSPLANISNFKDVSIIKNTDMDYYTSDEFLKFISVAREKAIIHEKQHNSLYDWNYYVFFNIAFYTGMRKGEINALQWTDIDGDIIHITKSVVQKLRGNDRITPPKNKSSVRDIQIPLPLQEVLKEHKQRLLDNGLYDENAYICGGQRAIRDTSLSKKNIEYANLAGLKHIRIHDFRHSHASLLANNGINIQEIARRLGHSKIEMTWNTYSHLYPRENEKAIEILNKIK